LPSFGEDKSSHRSFQIRPPEPERAENWLSDEIRATADAPLPRFPTPLSEVYGEIAERLMPYP
jgi:hypothetical protein